MAILWLKIPPELLTTESPTPAVPPAAQRALWLTFSQCGSHRSQTSCPLQPFVGFLPPLWSGEVAVSRVLSSQRRSPWALFWSPFGDIPGAPRASAGGGRGRDVSGFHTSLTTRSIGSKRSCRPETWHWLVSSLLLSKNIRPKSDYKELFHVKANLIRCLMYLQLCQIWDLQNAIKRDNCNFRLNSWVGLFFYHSKFKQYSINLWISHSMVKRAPLVLKVTGTSGNDIKTCPDSTVWQLFDKIEERDYEA